MYCTIKSRIDVIVYMLSLFNLISMSQLYVFLVDVKIIKLNLDICEKLDIRSVDLKFD